MGGLIQTKGTKLLAAHFNEEFSTYIDFYRLNANVSYFNTGIAANNPAGTGFLLNATNNLFDGSPHSLRNDKAGRGKCLLPYFPTGTRHANLEKRWLWFLDTSPAHVTLGSLTAANDIAIANAIYMALGNPTYDSITFDAVETTLPQQVAATPAYDDGTPYVHISLLTQQVIPRAGDAGTGLPRIDP